MQLLRIHRPGGYERLRVEVAPTPEPGPGQVLVATDAIGVNYADCVVRMGLYAAARRYVGWPITPGFELAGRVLRAGPGGGNWEAGTPVVGVLRFGAYASHVVVPEDQLFPLPAGLTPIEAASLPVAFLTAWHALHHLAHVVVGERLLVHSASGGVGGAILQLARITGCRSIGVVGAPHKVETAFRLGAADVVDRSRESLDRRARELGPEGYDVVLDANGAPTLRTSWRLLAPGGRLIVYGFHGMLPRRRGRPSWSRLLLQWLRTPRFSPLEMTTSNRSLLAFNLAFLFDRKEKLRSAMEAILDLARRGRIVPPPIRTFFLENAADAHRALESGETIGKLVLLSREGSAG